MREVVTCITYITKEERKILDTAFILLDSFAEKSISIELTNASMKAREALREVYNNVIDEEEG